jgi:hypothetical protein
MCVGFVFGAGLEIVRQGITGELSNTSFSGIAKNAGKAVVAGAAGAAGGGLASGVARISTSIAVRAAANGTAGAAIGAAATGVNNAMDGKELTSGMGTSAIVGSVLGSAGSIAGD